LIHFMKKALICGISGQDGGYLAKLLLEKDYLVYGTSRDAKAMSFANLAQLGIKDQIKFESLHLNNFDSVLTLLAKIEPDEVYNLAGQSSVRLSFEQPVETFESISIGALQLLEAIRSVNRPIRLYNAGSGECFGEASHIPANETTAFRPRSPYAVAKAAAFWATVNYRDAYNLFACSGILFNHESPQRAEHFVTQKIVAGVCRIAAGLQDRLELGNLSIQRDWGWAPEYVESMWLMLQQDLPDDFVIATGRTYSLEQFVEQAFSALGLDWKNYVVSDVNMIRPTDNMVSRADPSKAKRHLKWQAKSDMPQIVRMMIEAYQKLGAPSTQNLGEIIL
jgi:GDPmannose 4,6-dehydratase